MTQEKLLKAVGLGDEIPAREPWELLGIMAEYVDAIRNLAERGVLVNL